MTQRRSTPSKRGGSAGRAARMRTYAVHRVGGKTMRQAAKEMKIGADTACAYEKDPGWPALRLEVMRAAISDGVAEQLVPLSVELFTTVRELLQDANPTVRASAAKTADALTSKWHKALGLLDPAPIEGDQDDGAELEPIEDTEPTELRGRLVVMLERSRRAR